MRGIVGDTCVGLPSARVTEPMYIALQVALVSSLFCFITRGIAPKLPGGWFTAVGLWLPLWIWRHCYQVLPCPRTFRSADRDWTTVSLAGEGERERGAFLSSLSRRQEKELEESVSGGQMSQPYYGLALGICPQAHKHPLPSHAPVPFLMSCLRESAFAICPDRCSKSLSMFSNHGFLFWFEN